LTLIIFGYFFYLYTDFRKILIPESDKENHSADVAWQTDDLARQAALDTQIHAEEERQRKNSIDDDLRRQSKAKNQETAQIKNGGFIYDCNEEKNSLRVFACYENDDSAISLLKKMIAISKNDGGLQRSGELEFIKSKIESLPKASLGDKKLARSENEKGLAAFREENLEQARQHFLLAHQSNLADVEIADNLSYVYLRLSDLESSLKMLEKALTLSPDRASAWAQLANYYAKKNMQEESVACYAMTFRYSRNQDKTRLFLMQLANESPDPGVRKAAQKTLQLKLIQENHAEANSSYSLNDQQMPDSFLSQDFPQAQAEPGVKVPLYFAADLAPTENIPAEAPLCYKFMVAGPEAQLRKLKAKYTDLYDDKILKNEDGSKTLSAKRKDESGKIISYFYSTSPAICNDYQKRRPDLAVTSVSTPPLSTMAESTATALHRRLGDRYLDQGDGTATDTMTGLMWQRCSAGQTWSGETCVGDASMMHWNEAMPNGRQRRWPTFAGHADWRMPTKDELLTLVYCSSDLPKSWNDTGRSCEGNYKKPTIDQTAFPNTRRSNVWSGSPYANDPTVAWGVYFGGGNAYAGVQYDDFHVRLVRRGQ
jgi:tetratricopeptide (TPR) repeat protein